MLFHRIPLFILAWIALPVAAYARGCPEVVAGQSMAQMIGKAGGAEKLYKQSQGQIAEYDRWLKEVRKASGQGIREAQIKALIKQGKANQQIERQISAAARCYMGG
jgi:hypothetical protein